ncbi:hypothetical protein K2173_006032 [Erythroxylum novogranatense]|uniref:LOB domain-containing protein n=1 Tax=Erythroxylum novogranatense TaxID=1862640 RepID=A0AAV8TBN4_9ROSI|nr:hypothetical protein K2173_006032 [Erythroxylum novogranatense]
MSSPNSPCAACKLLRRKCTLECVFAPYFPPDQPQKFSTVHKVFGASNVAKLLNELQATQREDAVNSLAYEAEARLRDPVYGCVGLISLLQHKLKQLQLDLDNARKELANYIGPQAMHPILQAPTFIQPQLMATPSSSMMPRGGVLPMMGIPTRPVGPTHGGQLMIREPQPQQPQTQSQEFYDAQQLAVAMVAREQQEMLRAYEQQQLESVRYNSGLEGVGSVTATGFNQNQIGAGAMSPSLQMSSFHNPFHIQPQQGEHHHHQAQLLLQAHEGQPLSQQQQQPHQVHQQQQREKSEEGRSGGPSC